MVRRDGPSDKRRMLDMQAQGRRREEHPRLDERIAYKLTWE